jgi:hypothetical protein
LKRIAFLAPILLLALAPSARSADAPDPCPVQKKAWQDSVGPTEAGKTLEIWNACVALAKGPAKVDFVATRDAWAQSLDKLPNGGWEFLMVSPDGTYAIFGSHRHATREGGIVSLWDRYEFRESQPRNGGANYKSVVYREMYDCTGVRSKSVSNTYYSENNLSGVGPSYTYEEAKVAWAPVIPGTVGDSLLDWACKTTPRAQPAKAQ